MSILTLVSVTLASDDDDGDFHSRLQDDSALRLRIAVDWSWDGEAEVQAADDDATNYELNFLADQHLVELNCSTSSDYCWQRDRQAIASNALK
jgi:hypothetical protein